MASFRLALVLFLAFSCVGTDARTLAARGGARQLASRSAGGQTRRHRSVNPFQMMMLPGHDDPDGLGTTWNSAAKQQDDGAKDDAAPTTPRAAERLRKADEVFPLWFLLQ